MTHRTAGVLADRCRRSRRAPQQTVSTSTVVIVVVWAGASRLAIAHILQTLSHRKVTEDSIRRVFRDDTVERGAGGRGRGLVGRARRAGDVVRSLLVSALRLHPPSGHDADDARDLTQGFFTSLLERRDFEALRSGARPLPGVSARLAPALPRQRRRPPPRAEARRRHQLLPLQFDDAEGRYRSSRATATPETLFERRWALTVIDHVLASLRREWAAAGRHAEFDELKACLLGDASARRLRGNRGQA